ncbi:MAG: TIGR03668 family PPOX class F420-dependent oxidoreductase [Chloroflexi bacterium]|nr:MAG: TIGR03668 family PPOX class F420-dependent oxidoreductase [Chloroflexota bacterium]
MDAATARRRLGDALVARLATVGIKPHIVPICFALDGDTMYLAVDRKPKRTTELQRLRNIATNPSVAVLVDHYEDDWTRLWWVRVDGTARILDAGDESVRALTLLAARYPQYQDQRPHGPVVAIRIDRLTGWSAS